MTAVDVSPVMISSIAASAPPNLSYEVFDLNDRYDAGLGRKISNPHLTPHDSFTTFESNHFDLVNSRLVAGGINTERWSSYLRDIFRVLRPGGWCQMIEVYINAQSDNGTLTEGQQRPIVT